MTKICAKCGATFVPGPYQRRKLYCSPGCKKTNAEVCRESHQRNRDKRLAHQREYHAKNRDKILAYNRALFQETRLVAPWRNIMAGAKHRAKVANLPYDITHEWAKARWTGRCELSDIEFMLGLKPEDVRMFAASIDRIDPKKGYTQDNCRFILFAINCMRQDGTDEDVFRIAEAIIRTRHQ